MEKQLAQRLWLADMPGLLYRNIFVKIQFFCSVAVGSIGAIFLSSVC